MGGLQSPLFPMGLASPRLGLGLGLGLGLASPHLAHLGSIASPTGAAVKWNEIDPDAWYHEGADAGGPLGSIHDLFRDDLSSMFAGSANDQALA
jgi:hypothetical protein